MEYWIAQRYLFSSKQEGFLSVLSWFSFLGITLGVATLIVVMSVMNGFREELLTRLVGMRGHVLVQNHFDDGISDFLSLKKQVALNSHVDLVCPLIERQGVVLSKKITQGVVIRGMSRLDIEERPILASKLTTLDGFLGDRILVGQRMAERFNLKKGSSLTLMIPDMHPTAFGAFPKQKKFIVEGIFEVGMNDFDKSVVIIPLETAQILFKLPNQVNYLEVFLSNPTKDIVGQLKKTLGDQFLVIDWKHSDKHIFHAVKVERNVMFLILTLILVVASFNIISGLILLVKDKVRDIAILKTMGMVNSSILKIFIILGSMIGVGGTFIGLLLGLTISLNLEGIRRFLQSLLGTELFDAEIYFLSQLPSRVNIRDVLLVAAVGIGLSFLATLYPAFKASHLDPAKGISE